MVVVGRVESKPSDLEVVDFKRHNPNLKVWTPRPNLMAVILRLLNTWCMVGFHFVPTHPTFTTFTIIIKLLYAI